MNKLLVILGPTATGKTDLAIRLAKKFNGEIVSCDSRQVYKGLDIGTGKMPNESSEFKTWKSEGFWLINGVKVWMYDVVDPMQNYTAFDYAKNANEIIDDIILRGKLPIVVGGTGFYLKALLGNIPNLKVPINKKLREKLTTLSLEQLQLRLKKLSFKKWKSLNNSDKNNPRRLLRSIEIISMNPYIGRSKNLEVRSKKFDILKIGLRAPIEDLRKKINLRLTNRLDQGMIEEAKNLNSKGLSFRRMKELGLEYGALADLLQGQLTTDQLVEKLQFKVGQYAKRQLTWFKKEKNVNWFDITNQNIPKQVESKVEIWYHQQHHAAQN